MLEHVLCVWNREMWGRTGEPPASRTDLARALPERGG